MKIFLFTFVTFNQKINYSWIQFKIEILYKVVSKKTCKGNSIAINYLLKSSAEKQTN